MLLLQEMHIKGNRIKIQIYMIDIKYIKKGFEL